MIEKEIIVIDEDGNELKMEIEFTYTDEATSKEYVFYFDPSNEEELFVAGYDDLSDNRGSVPFHGTF